MGCERLALIYYFLSETGQRIEVNLRASQQQDSYQGTECCLLLISDTKGAALGFRSCSLGAMLCFFPDTKRRVAWWSVCC